MKRRTFLKFGVAATAGMAFGQLMPGLPLISEKNGKQLSYGSGDRISSEAFVQAKDLSQARLIDLCAQEPAVKVNILYIYGGGANNHEDRLGGIWCPDSFEDLHTLRFVKQKYDDSDVRIIPVACAPVYSSQYYGFEARVFLDQLDDSAEFQKSAKTFIASTEEIVKNKLLPVETYYDLRHRLLFNSKEDLKPAEGYGEIFDWQGKFRGSEETQKYGTPTIWLIDSSGKVLEEPFWGNYYHSKPYQISYTVLDLDQAIQRHLD